MEVRIKEGNGYVDADWTIEDGVMVECTEEVFNKVKESAGKIVKELYDYNTEVFKPLWDKKHFYKKGE